MDAFEENLLGILGIDQEVHIAIVTIRDTKGVYPPFLVKSQSSLRIRVLCINDIFTIVLLAKTLPYVHTKTFN